MLSLFLASMEGTVVATAMPSIVGQLGGLSIYSWVFSIYMLTSTTTVPIYGKLSDLFGRKIIYIISMSIFLGGSVLCGQARSMEQLIIFRGIQGLGAGGVLPLAFIIIGQLFTLEQRANIQGLFSGVWGISAVIGPLIGGFLVDQVSWQWVFYINIIPGLLAIGLVWFAWKEAPHSAPARVNVDYGGAGLITVGTFALLLGLYNLGSPVGWWCLAASAIFLTTLIWVEMRVPDPILPLPLFRDRLFTVSILHGILAGITVFGSMAYIPLFAQAVLGTSATQAGLTLTPMSVSWTVASIFGSRLLMKIGYRTLAIVGMILLAAGTFFMAQITANSSWVSIMLFTSVMGIGMGLSIPAFLIAVQSTVKKSDLGAATSTLQFFRSIGGTLGVSILGAYLAINLPSRLMAAGIASATLSLNSLIDPLARASLSLAEPIRFTLALTIANMFMIAFAAALAGLVVVFFAPPGMIAQLMQERASDQPTG